MPFPSCAGLTRASPRSETIVIPAQAGIQLGAESWTPASAGVTNKCVPLFVIRGLDPRI